MRYTCIQKGCGKSYTDVAGTDQGNAGDKAKATCLPCFFAGQMQQHSQNPKMIREGAPEIFAQLQESLGAMGWAWADLEDSFERVKVRL